jgi:hypothetical protein
MQVLPKGLLQHSQIQFLNLEHNSIGDMGATMLADILNNHNGGCGLKVESLDLEYNKIGVAGVLELVKASHAHTDWKELELDANTMLEFEDLTAVAKQLGNSKLSRLALYVRHPDYEYDDDDLGVTKKKRDPIQVQAQRKIAFQALIDAIQRNMYLVELEYVNIDDLAFKQEFDFYVNLNKFGRRFLLQNVEPALWPHVLAKKCGTDNISVLFYLLQEQPTLMMPTVAKKKRPRRNNMNRTTRSKRRRKRGVM